MKFNLSEAEATMIILLPALLYRPRSVLHVMSRLEMCSHCRGDNTGAWRWWWVLTRCIYTAHIKHNNYTSQSVSIYVRKYVGVAVSLSICSYVCTYMVESVSLYVRIYVMSVYMCGSVFLYVRTYVVVSVYLPVYTYLHRLWEYVSVCLYVCTCVRIRICTNVCVSVCLFDSI